MQSNEIISRGNYELNVLRLVQYFLCYKNVLEGHNLQISNEVNKTKYINKWNQSQYSMNLFVKISLVRSVYFFLSIDFCIIRTFLVLFLVPIDNGMFLLLVK